MSLLYNISIRLYLAGIFVASVFNKKAKLWLHGRKNIFSRIEKHCSENKKTAWFHCASLGEFEQGRPVIENFKKEYPDYKILITFFSPSGYEIRKNYDKADFVFYLPADTYKNARKFISIVNPEIVFFIKYEFWYNYLRILQQKNIPTIIFSSNFRKNQLFFRWYGKWFRNILRGFNHIFVQSKKSEQLLGNYGISNVSTAGDTRFDRVVEISKSAEIIDIIGIFKAGKKILIGGSTWEKDEDLLIKYFNDTTFDIKMIIAPHEIDGKHIEKIKYLLKKNAICLSEATKENIKFADCLIIDSIGKLSSIYKYADIAFIGGGFGKGIHNILEPAAFGLPVVFGPNYKKFLEAINLMELGGAKSIKTYDELKKHIDTLLENNNFYTQISGISHKFVYDNKGATKKIVKKAASFIS